MGKQNQLRGEKKLGESVTPMSGGANRRDADVSAAVNEEALLETVQHWGPWGTLIPPPLSEGLLCARHKFSSENLV